MADPEDRLGAAIKSYQARSAEAARRTAEDEQRRRESVQRQQQTWSHWAVTTHAMILNTVMSVGNSVARRGSPVLFRQMPPPRGRSAAYFELHESGNLAAQAWLQFDLTDDGRVSVHTSARGVDLPPPVSLNDVTFQWVEKIATDVFVAVAEGQGMHVPD